MDSRLNLPTAGLAGIPSVPTPQATPAAPAPAPAAAPAFGADLFAASPAADPAFIPGDILPVQPDQGGTSYQTLPYPADPAALAALGQQPVQAMPFPAPQPAAPQGLAELAGLKQSVEAQIAALEASAASGQVAPDVPAKHRALTQILNALNAAKPDGLPSEAVPTVQAAIGRLGTLAQAIAQGQPADDLAPEVFTLKHVLADPTRAGNLGAVNTGAQVLALVGDHRAAVDQALAAPNLDPARKQQLEACALALSDVEGAISRAKLTGLDAASESRANEAIGRLGDFVAGLATGESDPASLYGKGFPEAQTLADPTKPVNTASVQTGQGVLARIASALQAIKQKLTGLDEKVLNGAPPESVAGQRARLLERGEALSELGASVKRAKLTQTDPKARREVETTLARAEAIAKALEAGEPVAKHRAEIFALNQTFADPAGAKDNASVQSAAAAIHLIAQAESNALKRMEAAEARIAKGESPAKSDAERAAAWRQHEELEGMRQALEALDYTGLSTAQEAKGAQILEKGKALALKVAGGEPYAKHEAAFKQVLAEFKALKGSGGAPPAPKPGPLVPGGTYAVKTGDHLRKIAERELGDPERYRDIVELSKKRYPSLATNPDLIFPGWQLTLPKK